MTKTPDISNTGVKENTGSEGTGLYTKMKSVKKWKSSVFIRKDPKKTSVKK